METTQARTAELELAPGLERDALAIEFGADDEVVFDDGLPAKPVAQPLERGRGRQRRARAQARRRGARLLTRPSSRCLTSL